MLEWLEKTVDRLGTMALVSDQSRRRASLNSKPAETSLAGWYCITIAQGVENGRLPTLSCRYTLEELTKKEKCWIFHGLLLQTNLTIVPWKYKSKSTVWTCVLLNIANTIILLCAYSCIDMSWIHFFFFFFLCIKCSFFFAF